MNLPDWLTNLFSRQVTLKAALPLFLASAFIIAVPEGWATRLGMEGIRKEYALWLGFAFLLSGATLLSHLIYLLWDTTSPFVRDALFIQLNKKVLRNLQSDEKEVLRNYILKGEVSHTFHIGSGLASQLSSKRIIARAANVGVLGPNFHYIMQPWAREYLEKNPDLLD